VATAEALTDQFKAQQNREAAKIAAMIALLYSRAVDPESQSSVDRWLAIMVPRLVKAADDGAISSAAYYRALRQLEGVNGSFRATPTLGMVDQGVSKSLLLVGPYDYMNKAADIRRLDVSPAQQQALLRQAKITTTKAVTAAAMRHAQAGARQTVIDNTERDKVALGWVRVTKAAPCAFCAMLASRGITYRSFKQDSFSMSDPRFTGSGDAKVHDSCGCSIKPVYSKDDAILGRTQKFADMWSMWGAGGGDAALRFRRGYDHFRETGNYLTWDEANKGLRAA
jgi:hypothetical protein